MSNRKNQHRPQKRASLRWNELVESEEEEYIQWDRYPDGPFGLEDEGDATEARSGFDHDRWYENLARSSHRERMRHWDLEEAGLGSDFDFDFTDADEV